MTAIEKVRQLCRERKKHTNPGWHEFERDLDRLAEWHKAWTATKSLAERSAATKGEGYDDES